MIETIKILLKGIVIGLANIIPGVSGGTMALVMGIYERLIKAIHSIDIEFIKDCLCIFTFSKQGFARFKSALIRVDALFMLYLGIGAIAAIALSAHKMKDLLKNHHDPSYAFFFGLVMLSVIFPYMYLKRKSWKEVTAFIIATALTVSITFIVPEKKQIEKAEHKQALHEQTTSSIEQSDTEHSHLISLEHPGSGRLVFLFFAAALAISAMALPGISGSFVLLLLGAYFDILTAIDSRQVIVLGVFSLGLVLGLLAFARIINILLEKCYNITMAFMIGLMVGSLWILWPFRHIVEVGTEKLYLSPIIPNSIGHNEITSLGAFAVGCIIILISLYFHNKQETTSC